MHTRRTIQALISFAATCLVSAITFGQQIPNTLLQTITAPPSGIQSFPNPGFGRAVAASGSYAVIGAPYDDVRGDDAGVVKIFNAGSGELLHLIVNPEPQATQRFGRSVAIDGNYVVVGATYYGASSPISTGRGTAYVYDLAGPFPTVPIATLRSPSSLTRDAFGAALAISGNRIVVSSPGILEAGFVCVYDLATPTPTVPRLTFQNPNEISDTTFGVAVAISDRRLVITTLTSFGNSRQGRGYVYDLEGANPNEPLLSLLDPSPEDFDAFGTCATISGEMVAIGASSPDFTIFPPGQVYLFNLSGSTPTVPALTISNPDSEPGFASSVSMVGSRLVVGAMPIGGGGNVYVYEVNSPNPGTPRNILNPPVPTSTANYGISVAVTGDQVIVGAPGTMVQNASIGAVFSYNVSSGGTPASVVTLSHPSPASGDSFGSRIALTNDYLVVGAPGAENGAINDETGKVYVYSRSSGPTASLLFTIQEPTQFVLSGFGSSLAISGNLLAVGLGSGGNVYVYDLQGENPTVPKVTIPYPAAQTPGRFGKSLAISGARLLVGSPKDSQTDGRAYLYDLSSSTPTVPVHVLINPDADSVNAFGEAVAISGSSVVVGAPEDHDIEPLPGKLYLFNSDGETPTVPTEVLNNPNPATTLHFGRVLAVSGNRLVTSSQSDPWAGNDPFGGLREGHVYAYDLSSPSPKIPLTDVTIPDSGFGTALAIAGTHVAAGGAYETLPGDNSPEPPKVGTVRIYELNSGTPTVPVAKLFSAFSVFSDAFGFSLALTDSALVVGAPSDDTAVLDAGAAHIFASDEIITRSPRLVAPSTATVSAGVLAVEFNLPETAYPGSLKLTFTGATTTVLTLASSQEAMGTHSFAFDTSNPSASASIANGETVPDGIYVVTLSYRDQFDNPSASAMAVNVMVDRTSPEITDLPADVMVAAPDASGAVVNYSMPTVSDAVKVGSLRPSVPSGALFPPGMTTVVFVAKDAAGNSSTAEFRVFVRPYLPVLSRLLSQGDDTPDAGIPGGPPTGAKLASFGVPAVDAEGHVAFTAKWTSGEGSGIGLLRDDTFIAKVGGSVSGLSGATFKSFTEPAIDAGHLAFFGTAAGVPKARASVLVSDVSGTLETVAQSGTSAPGTGEATFKSFKNVSVSGDSVGVLAQLTPGTGATRTTAANDFGLWVKDGADPLVLVLREGQEIAPGKKIKTLVSFAGGNGSPGQGRGWLIDTGDSARVLAHAVLTDKSQAIIAVAHDDLSHPTILSQSGAGSGFASYSLPAMNPANQSAFLGSLSLGGDVTKANARGIFADLEVDGTYSSIARVGDPAVTGDGTFNLLKDPVLAADGGIAFPATIKGKTVKGTEMQTLWWKPPGGELTLLAQGGAGSTPVADIPGAQWKSFPSLAIAANRGPIFAGTLVPGKGGVTKATSNGLWATDFQGNLRLLVQSGVTQIDGKTVKSFTLLNANVGSQGSTRSFNDNAFVVWRATFTDKSQAIVKTEVP